MKSAIKAFRISGDGRTIGLRPGWLALGTLAALVALSFALVFVFTQSTRVADDLAREDERLLVARYMDRTAATIATAQSVQTTWDDAMRRASIGNDTAWQDTFIGEFFWNHFKEDAVFLVRPDGSLMRSYFQGRPSDSTAYQEVRWQVEGLIGRAQPLLSSGQASFRMLRLQDTDWPIDRAGRPLSTWAGMPVIHRGRPAFLTVISIIPDHDFALLKRKPSFVASLRYFDSGWMEQMGRDLILPGVAFRPGHILSENVNQVPVENVFGDRLGWIEWDAKTPGPTIVRRTAPLLVAYLLFFLGIAVGSVKIVRRLRLTTQELQASEAQAQHNSMHDAMSGLPNRGYYMQRLRTQLAASIAGTLKGNLFVAYIDLDSFKVINDTLGHQIGDELVREVAARLRRNLPPQDFLSRFGGDEFVLLRCAPGGRESADALGAEIMALMREPFVISGTTLDVTCSCGISWGPEQSEDPAELLRRADIAMYRAKQRGRSRYRCFTHDMDASAKLRGEMETELRRAISKNELSLAYQPIVAIDSGAIRGFEALLRWEHRDRGNIRPDLFVPIAERGGLMVPLGNWMLRHVFTECRNWPDCDISVNLSPVQIMAADFVATMSALIAETGMDPRRVVLEITEGVMLDRSAHVVGVLRALGQMGFRIALDDFGTGYSSLAYLRSFQFDRIKIDRSFVQNIEGDNDARSILSSIVSLGRNLRMKVVAEGVETEIQRLLVQAAGCDLVQGYLFWKPMPASEARALLGQGDDALRMRLAG
jgi:diguanylate cyclase (GGDEF)-like protein